ncbi:hypothetical protein [Streptomyces sp. NBC_00057]|uniref:hypothetical protein n=1 Tax=Streptomyces sp. NBC_00057 TaxID=2975634 RepID=UPI0032507D26
MPENTLPLPSTARPGASAADADAVWAVLTGMYEGCDAGDRARIDQAFDPRATVEVGQLGYGRLDSLARRVEEVDLLLCVGGHDERRR